jgi:hypothetical protein
MKQIKWFVTEFLPQLLVEFVWLMFSVSFGMAIVATGMKIPTDVFEQTVFQYGQFVILVVFNAAALRVILRFFTEWADRWLTVNQAASEQTRNDAAMGVKLLLHTITRTPVKTDEPIKPNPRVWIDMDADYELSKREPHITLESLGGVKTDEPTTSNLEQ